MHLFNCFPIKHNKILLFSYYGSQYRCNPKYIAEYIVEHYPNNHFDIVLAFNDPDRKQYPRHFRKVRMLSLKYFYELCTPKVIITNYRMTDLFIKRKKQYYIQTWHSSLRLKQIEKDAEDVLPERYKQMAKKDSRKCDLLLSGCEYSSIIFKRAFWYDGEIFEHGTPRNDMLFEPKKDERVNVLRRLKISEGANVLLYAPTFRNTESVDAYKLDWDKITEKLTDKFGGDWVILVKLHPHAIREATRLTFTDNIRNVSNYDDMQELLMCADVLISDYSSLIFDYSITKRPCFLYVPDINEYTSQERGLYFDILELPFISAESNDDLLEEIASYQEGTYKEKLELFLKQVGSFEDGNASANLLQRINDVCFERGRGANDEKEAV